MVILVLMMLQQIQIIHMIVQFIIHTEILVRQQIAGQENTFLEAQLLILLQLNYISAVLLVQF